VISLCTLGLNKGNVYVQKLIANAEGFSLVKPEDFSDPDWKNILFMRVIRNLRGSKQKMKEAKKAAEHAETKDKKWQQMMNETPDIATIRLYYDL
jgi:hypothetical protein